jgi:hypothetical protein
VPESIRIGLTTAVAWWERLAIVVCAVLVLWGPHAGAAAPPENPSPYAAAAVEGLGVDGSQILVFPFDAPSFTLTTDVSLQWVAFAPGGRALYATGWRRGQLAAPLRNQPNVREALLPIPGLLRIELGPSLIVTTVPGSTSFSDISNFAVSPKEDVVVLSGRRQGGRTCGVYELTLKSGANRPLVESADCHVAPWDRVALTPSAERAIVRTVPEVDRVGRILRSSQGLVEIDLAALAVAPFRQYPGFPQWSPDGKSVAWEEQNGNRWSVALANGKEASQPRRIASFTGGAVPISWSPDSRYLLFAGGDPACGSPARSGMLVQIDTANGESSTVPGSECRFSSVTVGWVSLTAPPG